MGNNIPALWSEEKYCCGCSACYAICPVQAINMQENRKGFLYPVIDESKCIKCGACERVCAYKKDLNDSDKCDGIHKIYAVKAKDEDILEKSSSGGMFTILSDWMFSNQGAVISAIYNNLSHKVEFYLYDDVSTRNSARGSKYIQADMAGIFTKAYEWLQKNPGKKLLFIGTGCQAAGFAEYISKKNVRDRVFVVDLICHGAPSPGLWKEYATSLEKKQKGKISKITFKDKRNGWLKPSVYAIVNDKEISIKGYSSWFYGEYSIRESCYQCPYTKIKRNTDITIGDFWGVNLKYPEFYSPMGVSLAIIQSEAGQKIFNELKKDVDYMKISSEDCMQPRLISPANRPKNCDKFWNDVERKGLAYCERKYKEIDTNTFLFRAKRKLKRFFGRCE